MTLPGAARGPRARHARRARSPATPSLAAGLLGLLALAGCGGDAQPPNVLLISIDTLRADRLGCYGYERPTSPFLDRMAAEGVLFEDASATSSWTYPSHASMFTGLYPGRNGATELKQRVRADVPSLAEWLVERGYRCAGVVSSSLFGGYGLERGFEQLYHVEPGGPEPSQVTAESIEWLQQVNRARPFFFLVHYLDPHSDYKSLPEHEQPFLEPYDGPATGESKQLFDHVSGFVELTPADGRHLSNLYDGGVRQQDAELEKLFAYLRESGLLEDTVIVLTSDHGEEFLEHGEVLHGLQQYDETVRVPLIVWGPGVPRGVRVRDPVSLVDVMPTVLDLLDVPAPAELDGRSLRELWEAPERAREPRALFVEADMDPPGPTSRVMVPGDDLAVRKGRWKLVLDPASGATRLFDLATDPGETRDVVGEHPEVSRELMAELERFRERRARQETAPALTPEDMRKLQDLGYAGDEGDEGG